MNENSTLPTRRYLSIDIFRGATICLMLIVNTPGSWQHVFPPLLHAEWHGCTLTDMVFPAFLFIIGVSMWFSFEKYGRRLSRPVFFKILRRAGLLVLLGLLLAKFPFFWENLDKWRFPGVLQRLGLCYGLAAVLVLSFPNRLLVLVAAILLLSYWAALWFFNPADPFSLENNLVRQLDLLVFGENHIWKGKGIPFDPEGLLSTQPAIVTVLLGWWSGQILSKNLSDKFETVRSLLLFGVAIGAAGLAWSMVFPLNKYLWTSSYVLYTGGICMVVLAATVWAADIQNWRGGVARFFQIYGSNALFAYLLAGVLVKTMLSISWLDASKKSGKGNVFGWIYENVFAQIEAGKTGSLLFALTFMMLVWLVCWILWRRRWFFKL